MHIPFSHLPAYGFRRICERWRANRSEKYNLASQWHLLVGEADKAGVLSLDPKAMRKLIAPADRYWADPFGWRGGGEFFIFCEEVFYRERKGHISVLSVDVHTGIVAGARMVVEEPYHLSYPFLFEFEDTLYMLPESGFSSLLNLYRCVEFPHRWEKVRPLFEGVQYYDPTLHEHEGRWWLFVTVRNPKQLQLPDHDLLLFSAESPLARQWTPHPANPVVRGFRRARPGGRIFNTNGRLYRPSQNCLFRYGASLNINEIVRFDAEHYEEQLVKELRPSWDPSYVGLHHLDWHDGVVLMDAHRVIPRTEAMS